MIAHYGERVGGDSDHCRLLAEAYAEKYNVDILTTHIGQKQGEPDEETARGVRVVRFDRIAGSGVRWSTAEEYLNKHQVEYFAIIVITGNDSFRTIFKTYENVIYMPLAHDTPEIRRGIYAHMAEHAAGFLFNTVEEKILFCRYHDIKKKPFKITTYFVEEKKLRETEEETTLPENYVVYVGRVSSQKNFWELNEFFLRYKKRFPSDLKLVVIGKINTGTLLLGSEDILYAGFVSNGLKQKYMASAKALLIPSLQESLSIVLLESLFYRVPVLVNGKCDVLRGQCDRSGGGLYYENFEEFCAGLHYLLEVHEEQHLMAESGYQFVKIGYARERVLDNIEDLFFLIRNKEYEKKDDDLRGAVENPFHVASLMRKIYPVESREMITEKMLMKERFLRSMEGIKEVVIVGAGNVGTAAYQTLKDAGMDTVVAFADNRNEEGNEVFGIREFSVEEAAVRFPGAFYLITPIQHKWELVEQLADLGIKRSRMDLFSLELQ